MLLIPSTKQTISLVVACLVVVGGATGSGQTSKHGKHNPPSNLFIKRQLSGPVTLTSEWLELKPTEPLKAVRDTQELTLFPNPPIQMVFERGTSDLIPADGRKADIEAELIGSDGITYHSRPGLSETMTGNLRITSRSLGFKDLPQNVTQCKQVVATISATSLAESVEEEVNRRLSERGLTFEADAHAGSSTLQLTNFMPTRNGGPTE